MIRQKPAHGLTFVVTENGPNHKVLDEYVIGSFVSVCCIRFFTSGSENQTAPIDAIEIHPSGIETARNVSKVKSG